MIVDAIVCPIEILCARCEERVPAGQAVFARLSEDDTADENGETAVCWRCISKDAAKELDAPPATARAL